VILEEFHEVDTKFSYFQSRKHRHGYGYKYGHRYDMVTRTISEKL